MNTLERAVADFLAQRHIAVAGVSRNPSEAANLIYRKFRASGYDVYAVNPSATTVEGDVCYPDLASVPVRLDGLVAVTPPAATAALVEDCAALGIPRVWMHRGLGAGSVSKTAVEHGRAHGIEVIPGACPMMFLEPVDVGHRCIRAVSRAVGRLPEPVLAG
jgi:predicted CoA-binding protein